MAALFHASVHGAGSRDYTPEQVTAWSPAAPDPQNYLRRTDERLLLVAEGDDGRPVGYGDLGPDGHIDHLYCRPDMVGTGVGSALCAVIERAARQRGIRVLFVEASEAARRLLARRGFAVEARRSFSLRGATIHNYRITKAIG